MADRVHEKNQTNGPPIPLYSAYSSLYCDGWGGVFYRFPADAEEIATIGPVSVGLYLPVSTR